MSEIQNVEEKRQNLYNQFYPETDDNKSDREGESPLEPLPETIGNPTKRKYKKSLSFGYLDANDPADLLAIIYQYGANGKAVYIELLQKIWRSNGYYCSIDEKEKRNIYSILHIEKDLFDDIFTEIIESEIFDIDLFKEYGILTNEDLQVHYQKTIKKHHRREYEIDERYKLIPEKSELID